MGHRQLDRVFILGSILAAGCGGPTEPGGSKALQVDMAWVTGAAAAAVGSDGLFRFESPAPNATGELVRDSVLALADAAVRFLGGSVGGAWGQVESEHGAPIDYRAVRRCRRVVRRLAMFLDPGSDTPHYIRTPLGPSEQIDYCDTDGWPVLGVEVFVWTKARALGDGTIAFPTPLGTEFTVRGHPIRPTVDLSPEYAVQKIFSVIGLRIAQIPEMDGCLSPLVPCIGRIGLHWVITLERKVRVKLVESDRTMETDRFAVQSGYGSLEPGGVYVLSPVQPPATWQPFDRVGEGGVTTPDSVLLALVRPLALEHFTILK